MANELNEKNKGENEPKASIPVDGRIQGVFTDMDELNRAVAASGFKNPLINYRGMLSKEILDQWSKNQNQGDQ